MSALVVRVGQPSQHASIKIACQGSTADWRVVLKEAGRPREFKPVAFDAREQTVWVVCRPCELDRSTLGVQVEVGELEMLACDTALVITAWSPETFAAGVSTEWTGGALVPNSSRVTMPDPPIGAPPVAATPLLPDGYERNGEGCQSPQTSEHEQSSDPDESDSSDPDSDADSPMDEDSDILDESDEEVDDASTEPVPVAPADEEDEEDADDDEFPEDL